MLIYDQPIERAKPEGRPAALAPAGFSVLELIQLLWQRKAAIASAALIAACAAVAVGKSLTPKYTASAQLYVDPRELQLVDRELTPRAQDMSGLAMVVESQARVITSNNVLLQVIGDTNLEKGSEFGGSDGKGLLGSLLGLVGSTCGHQPNSRSRSGWARWKRSIATSTSRRPTAASSSISTSGPMSRPRRRCSPTRSRRPISPSQSSRRPLPRGAPPPTCPAG